MFPFSAALQFFGFLELSDIVTFVAGTFTNNWWSSELDFTQLWTDKKTFTTVRCLCRSLCMLPLISLSFILCTPGDGARRHEVQIVEDGALQPDRRGILALCAV